MATLKEQIQQALNLPESDFSNHESDLYVKHTQATEDWLKENYEFYSNIRPFYSRIDGCTWLDIPFGFMDEHYSARFRSTAIRDLNKQANTALNNLKN